MSLTGELHAYQWALPDSLEIPPDELKCRLDFYEDSIVLYMLEDGVIKTRVVSARDIALAFLREFPLDSGLLPENTLFWGQGKRGVEVGLWRSPRIWPVAVVVKALEAPVRFKIPMPGLIFVCTPAQPPRVYAAKKRPKSVKETLYHAPLFNVFNDGRVCSGTHKFPASVSEIPESFFMSFFSMEADYRGRSKRHPDSLFSLWQELDGKKKYPLGDLMPIGKVSDILNENGRSSG